MTVKDLRDLVNELPEEMDSFEIVNGEIGTIDENGKNAVYRVDKSVVALYVDEQERQVCLFHQTQEDIKNLVNPNIDGTTKES